MSQSEFEHDMSKKTFLAELIDAGIEPGSAAALTDQIERCVKLIDPAPDALNDCWDDTYGEISDHEHFKVHGDFAFLAEVRDSKFRTASHGLRELERVHAAIKRVPEGTHTWGVKDHLNIDDKIAYCHPHACVGACASAWQRRRQKRRCTSGLWTDEDGTGASHCHTQQRLLQTGCRDLWRAGIVG